MPVTVSHISTLNMLSLRFEKVFLLFIFIPEENYNANKHPPQDQLTGSSKIWIFLSLLRFYWGLFGFVASFF